MIFWSKIPLILSYLKHLFMLLMQSQVTCIALKRNWSLHTHTQPTRAVQNAKSSPHTSVADLWACSANAPGRVKTQHGVIGEGQRRPFRCEEDVLRTVRHVAHFGWSTTTCKYSRTQCHKIQQKPDQTLIGFYIYCYFKCTFLHLGPMCQRIFSLSLLCFVFWWTIKIYFID